MSEGEEDASWRLTLDRDEVVEEKSRETVTISRARYESLLGGASKTNSEPAAMHSRWIPKMTPLLVLLLVGLAAGLPFPFELGGDQARDLYYPYRPMASANGFGHFGHPSMRNRIRSRPHPRSRAAKSYRREPQEEEEQPQGERMSKEDEEKVRQAMETRDFIVDKFLPMMRNIIPGPNMMGGMIPRMRRSAPVFEEDQLGLPSEQLAVAVSAQSEPAMAFVPVLMPAEARSSLGQAEGRSSEETESVQGSRGARGTEGLSFPLAQILPASLVPRPPQASISSSQADDKIYFAVDRQTILDFLGALFRGDKPKQYHPF